MGTTLVIAEMERFKALTFFPLLRNLRPAACPTPRRGVVIADNASSHQGQFHRQGRAWKSHRFPLDSLPPPHSPDLNPIARVWKLTRRCSLPNRYFGSLEEIIEAVESPFNRWTVPNETLHRLCANTWDALHSSQRRPHTPRLKPAAAES